MDRSGLNKDRYFWALSAMESQIAIIDQACLDKMAGNKPRFFFCGFFGCIFVDVNFVPVHKKTPINELDHAWLLTHINR